MKKSILFLALFGLLVSGCNFNSNNPSEMENPLLSSFDTPFGVPPFEQIQSEHYMPAFREAMIMHKENVQKIIDSKEEPTFENTIVALETSGQELNKVASVFYNLLNAETNEVLQQIARKLSPLMSSHQDDIGLNEKLFEKVQAVYEKRESLNLTTEEQTLLKNTYNGFVRGGAKLNNEEKDRFREINKELSMLSIQFGENLLKENNKFELVIDNEADLAGLSENSIAAAASTAEAKGYEGKWAFTIHKPSLLPFLENAENRDLREKMYMAYIMKGDNNDSLDNKASINKIVNLRVERANLLGFDSHAAFVLDKNMAKTSDKVYELLDQLMPPALKVAKKEIADMQAIIDSEGGKFKLAPWDYWYYAAKVKEQKYALNENDIRPYLKLENARDGMFWLANQLYGISFTKLDDMPIYHNEVEVFEVNEADGSHVGVLYMDYHPRASKRSGAWCTSYRGQRYENNERIAPVMSIVCNFSAPVGDTPALLSVDETQTLFHEFGHALDGLFANKHYSSLRVPRDFVELPSQIMENWAFTPEVLAQYAKHYETGELMPQELIEKIQKAGKFNQGFVTTEYLAASYLDMDYHTQNSIAERDINAFEKESMAKINLMDEIVPRYRSTYFQHVFSGGYSSGYYSYIWAAVLDTDAFEAFKENGLFDKTTAAAFRNNVLELGGTQDPMELYVNFRGAEPKIDPLLQKRGLN